MIKKKTHSYVSPSKIKGQIRQTTLNEHKALFLVCMLFFVLYLTLIYTFHKCFRLNQFSKFSKLHLKMRIANTDIQ